MIGGRPARTYVKGDTRLAISTRFGRLASHWTAYVFRLGPSSRSTTSVIPYQSTTAAIFSSSLPGHSRSSPSEAGIIAVVNARCPPAEPPDTTILLVSKLYCLALRITQRSAHRQSSTAAGASDTLASLYSTLTTFQPISRYGRRLNVAPSLLPPVQPPP